MAIPTSGKIYTFVNVSASSRALNLYYSNGIVNGQNVCLWTKDNSLEQQWKYQNNKLLNMRNNTYALDKYTVANNANNNNADVWTSNDPTNQNIVFESVSGNIVKIKLASSGLYLTAYNNANGNNTAKTPTSSGNVFWASNTSNTLQQWTFSEVGGSSGGGTTPSGTQRLVSPFGKGYITTDYKYDSKAYKPNYKAIHYGIDFSGRFEQDILSCGQGTVIAIKRYELGPNSRISLGNVVTIKYDNVIDKNGNNVGSLVVRYCHLKDNANVVTTGETVSRGQKISKMGATIGQSAVHLHMEVATPLNVIADSWKSPTQGHEDTTIDPFDVLHRTSQQILQPDSAVNGNSTDDAGNKWYNEDKINNMPITI